MSFRPRRSVLYMPGSNQRALEKSRTLKADTLIFDLEDAVSPDKKHLARQQVVAALKAGGYGKREIIVRVNGLDSEWGEDDITAVAVSGAAGICLPKIENEIEVEAAVKLLNDAGAPGAMQVWVMIETPLGVQNVNHIAGADTRISVMVMGTTDLAYELHVPHTDDRIGLQYALSRCVVAARVHGKDILDGVYLNIKNENGFLLASEQGRHLGFDGKTLIHPSQIAAANQIFGLSDDDVIHARKVIAAWRDAEADGKAVVLVDGRLIEAMHVEEARRQIGIADMMIQLGTE
ncbi:MAG: CoA ester lyase [Oceanicoccus sp.]